MSDLIEKLKKLNEDMRANSICWNCGKPREGIRGPRAGGLITPGYDESGTECECVGIALPQSYASAGLCTCERVEIICKETGLRLTEHPAADGLLVDFTPGIGGLADVTLETKNGNLTVNADAFAFPVFGRIVARDQPMDGICFDFMPPIGAEEIAQADATYERRCAEA